MNAANIGTKLPSMAGDLDNHKTELHVDYPLLKPGRALIDMENNELYEIFHGPEGGTQPIERSYIHCYGDDEFNTITDKGETVYGKEGVDFGHVIVQQFIAYRKLPCPTPNENGEIAAPGWRPSDCELTFSSPDEFVDRVFDGDGRTPLALLERPAVSYEETTGHETYDVLGWYNPYTQNIDRRLRDLSEIGELFPGLDGLDQPKLLSRDGEHRHFPGLGLDVQWDQVPDDLNIWFAFAETGADIRMTEKTGQIHFAESVEHEVYNGVYDFRIESDKSTKDHIKALPWDLEINLGDGPVTIAHPTWNPDAGDYGMWEIDYEALPYAVHHFLSRGLSVSIPATELEPFGHTVPSFSVAGELGDSAYDAINSEHEDFYRARSPLYQDYEVEITCDLESVSWQSRRAPAPDKLSLLALESTLMSGHAPNGARISLNSELTEVPESIKQAWSPAIDVDDDEFRFYNSQNGCAVTVSLVTEPPTESPEENIVVGQEYQIDVHDTKPNEYGSAEDYTAVTLADERMAVQTTVTLMEAMTE